MANPWGVMPKSIGTLMIWSLAPIGDDVLIGLDSGRRRIPMSRTNCCQCGVKIPPGREGRKCKACRGHHG